GHRGLGVLHRQVDVPVVGDAGHPVVAHPAGHEAVALGEVEVAAELLVGFQRRPAHQLAVEGPAPVGAGGEEVHPAGGADGGGITRGHERLLCFGNAVCQWAGTTAAGGTHRSGGG